MRKLCRFTKSKFVFILFAVMFIITCITLFGLKPQMANAMVIRVPHVHTWKDYRIIKQPTCTADGLKLQKCTSCTQQRTITVSKVGHRSNGSYTITKQPTCSTPGQRVLKCTRCSAILNTISIPATENHSAQLATISNTHMITAKCVNCSYYQPNVNYAEYIKYSSIADDATSRQLYMLERGCKVSQIVAVERALDEYNTYKQKNPNIDTIATRLVDADLNSDITFDNTWSTTRDKLGKIGSTGDCLKCIDEHCKVLNVAYYINIIVDAHKTFSKNTSDCERVNSLISLSSDIMALIPGGNVLYQPALEALNSNINTALKTVANKYDRDYMNELYSHTLVNDPIVSITRGSKKVDVTLDKLTVSDLNNNEAVIRSRIKDITGARTDNDAQKVFNSLYKVRVAYEIYLSVNPSIDFWAFAVSTYFG